MDWYMSNDPAHLRQLRLALGDHLGRHAAPGSDIDGALLVASELVTNSLRYGAGSIWISVDWGGSEPILTVYDLGDGFDLAAVPVRAPDDVGGRGLLITSHLVRELSVRSKSGGGSVVTAVPARDACPVPQHRHAAVHGGVPARR